MIKFKDEKGVTLAALMLIIVTILLISAPILVNVPNVSKFKKYANMKQDLDKLNEAIGVAYSNYNSEDISRNRACV